jgi:uncharacterized protein Yka (UPF0111/DUF47 family)
MLFNPNKEVFFRCFDAITHEIYEKMHTAYLSSGEPEDVYALAGRMDSILDLIESTAARMKIYKIKEPFDDIEKLAKTLGEVSLKIRDMVHGLKDRKNFEGILESCAEIRTLERAGDDRFREALAGLFEREQDAVEIFKRKEILEKIEEAIHTGDDVSDIPEGIVLKHG